MTTLRSPFTPGDLPRVLVGRVPERTRLRDLLARVTAYGELAGPPVVLHAPRGLGKTSLLRDTEDRARELGFVTAWVACAKGSTMPVSYTHLRAHETVLDLVCRLLLEKKKSQTYTSTDH